MSKSSLWWWADVQTLLKDKILSGEVISKRVSFFLFKRGVEHRICRGWVMDIRSRYKIGWWWVELPDGRIVDFCYREIGGGGVNLPYGVFDRFDFLGEVMYHRMESWDCWPYEEGWIDLSIGGLFMD